jgi:hypothetical protein
VHGNSIVSSTEMKKLHSSTALVTSTLNQNISRVGHLLE